VESHSHAFGVNNVTIKGAVSQTLTESVKKEALSLGFDTVGIATADRADGFLFYQDWLARGMHAGMDYLIRYADLRGDVGRLLPGTQSVIAVTLAYRQPEPMASEVKIAQYARGRDYHRVLRNKLKKLAIRLDVLVPGHRHRACVDSAPILEREYAHRAGLGWFGKNTMLIDSRRGSWFFIGILLTTLPLDADRPAHGGCGTCHACVDACPTGAIVQFEGRWQVDARTCISYLTIEHRGQFTTDQAAQVGDWTFGCDVCQDVCPFNQARASQPLRASPTREADLRPSRTWPDLETVANMSYEEWDRLTEGSAVRRAGFEGLRRNARANLRNRHEGSR